jgi:hypothetical protein
MGNGQSAGYLFFIAALVYGVWVAMVVLPWWVNGLVVFVGYKGFRTITMNILYIHKVLGDTWHDTIVTQFIRDHKCDTT